MADRELTIRLTFAKQAAERAAQQFHQNERRRIRETAETQGKVDRELDHDLRQRAIQADRDGKRRRKSYLDSLKQLNDQYFDGLERSAAAYQKKIESDARARRKAHLASLKQLNDQYFDAIERREAESQKKAQAHGRATRKAYLDSLREMNDRHFDGEEKREKESQKKAQADAKRTRQSHLASLKQLNDQYLDGEEKREKEAEASKKRIRQDYLASLKQMNDRYFSDEAAKDQDRTRKFLSNQGFLQERLRKESEKTGVAQRDEFKKTGEAMEKNTGQISVLAKQYILFRAAERSIRLVADAFRDMVQSTSDANKHIEGMFERTERLRDSLTEVIRMSGKEPSAKVTADEAERIAKFGVPMQAGVAAVSEFEAQAGPFIGAGPEHRMTRQQSEDFLQFAVPHAASIGLRDAEGQKAAQMVAATMMQNAPVGADGKVDVNKLKLEYAKAIRTVQKAVGHNSPAAMQFAEAYRMHAFGAKSDSEREELQLIFAAMSEVTVDGERVAMDALFRGLRQIKEDDSHKGRNRFDELGLKRGMSDVERLHAADAAIRDKAKQEGMSIEEAARDYFDEEREYRGYIGYRKMLDSKGDVRMRAERAQVTLKGAEADNAAYLARPEARIASERAKGEAAEARRVAERGTEEYEVLRQQVRNRITTGGELEEGEPLMQAWRTGKTQEIGLGNRQDFMLHQMTGDEIRKRLEALAAQGSEQATRLLNEKGGRLTASPTNLYADRNVQEELFAEVRRLEKDAQGRRGAGLAPFASELAVGNAARSRAFNELMGRGAVPKGIATLDQLGAKAGAMPSIPDDFGRLRRTPEEQAAQAAHAAVERRTREIIAEQRKAHGADNEAILRSLTPPSNGAANEAHLRRLNVVIPPALLASEGVGAMRGHGGSHAARRGTTRYRLEHMGETRARMHARDEARRARMHRIDHDYDIDEHGRYRPMARHAHGLVPLGQHIDADWHVRDSPAALASARGRIDHAQNMSRNDPTAGALMSAARALKSAARPAVPPAMPGRPHVIRN